MLVESDFFSPALVGNYKVVIKNIYRIKERSLSWTIRTPELILKLDTNQ